MPTTVKPLRLPDSYELDELEVFEPVQVLGRDLRGGEVILDPDLGCAAGVVDHKVTRSHQGAAAWMVYDLETRRYVTERLGDRSTFTVAAAR